MNPGKAFIESYLSHAQPQFYDPVKAHEYYMKTRELKGRREGLKTDTQKQAFAFSKTEIAKAKKGESEAAAANHKKLMEQTRANAEAKRTEIHDKLKALMERLSAETAADSAAATAKIKALPPIPKGLSKQATARAAFERSQKIALIRGEVEKGRDTAKLNRQNARDSATADRDKLRTDVKASVDTARANYTALKEKLKKKYETATDKEFQAIKENV